MAVEAGPAVTPARRSVVVRAGQGRRWQPGDGHRVLQREPGGPAGHRPAQQPRGAEGRPRQVGQEGDNHTEAQGKRVEVQVPGCTFNEPSSVVDIHGANYFTVGETGEEDSLVLHDSKGREVGEQDD